MTSCVVIRGHGWSVIQSTIISYRGGVRWCKDWCAPSITVDLQPYNTSSVTAEVVCWYFDTLLDRLDPHFPVITAHLCIAYTRQPCTRQSLAHSMIRSRCFIAYTWSGSLHSKTRMKQIGLLRGPKILTDFQNSFTRTRSSKFAIKRWLNSQHTSLHHRVKWWSQFLTINFYRVSSKVYGSV